MHILKSLNTHIMFQYSKQCIVLKATNLMNRNGRWLVNSYEILILIYNLYLPVQHWEFIPSKPMHYLVIVLQHVVMSHLLAIHRDSPIEDRLFVVVLRMSLEFPCVHIQDAVLQPALLSVRYQLIRVGSDQSETVAEEVFWDLVAHFTLFLLFDLFL